MNTLVSVIMPTRNASVESLTRAVNSILETAGSRHDQVEFLLRVDSDDTKRIFEAVHLTQGRGCVVVGPRGEGYNDMCKFVEPLVRIAKGQWCWLFDDDAWVQGDWVSHLLRCVAPEKTAFSAEHYWLGTSHYVNNQSESPVGLIVPTVFCREIVCNLPVDQVWLDSIHDQGWYVRKLSGVTYHHDGRPRV